MTRKQTKTFIDSLEYCVNYLKETKKSGPDSGLCILITGYIRKYAATEKHIWMYSNMLYKYKPSKTNIKELQHFANHECYIASVYWWDMTIKGNEQRKLYCIALIKYLKSTL